MRSFSNEGITFTVYGDDEAEEQIIPVDCLPWVMQSGRVAAYRGRSDPVLLTIGFFVARPAVAHAAGVDGETQFVFNTFAFLVWGSLVMWMCGGFTMLESARCAPRTPL